MQRITKLVGLDVHRETIAVGVADARGGAVRSLGTIANRPSALRALLRRLAPRPERVRFCYVAGPTGFGTYRLLNELGTRCEVIAPSLIPRRPGDRIKTDRRAAWAYRSAAHGARSERRQDGRLAAVRPIRNRPPARCRRQRQRQRQRARSPRAHCSRACLSD